MNETFEGDRQDEEFQIVGRPTFEGVILKIAREPRPNESPIDRFKHVHYHVRRKEAGVSSFVTIQDPEVQEKTSEFLMLQDEVDQGKSNNPDLATAADVLGISVDQLLRGAKIARDIILKQRSQ